MLEVAEKNQWVAEHKEEEVAVVDMVLLEVHMVLPEAVEDTVHPVVVHKAGHMAEIQDMEVADYLSCQVLEQILWFTSRKIRPQITPEFPMD